MTVTRFIGDVHGYKNELKLILDNIPDHITNVVQVGDLGVGFGQGDYWHDSINSMLENVNGKFIRGNHDNPNTCKKMSTWIPNGTIVNDVMYLGGAWSIDYQWRTMGVDIWEDEELSIEELNQLIDIYDLVRPSIMVTHDTAETAAAQLFINTGESLAGGVQFRTKTGSALEAMFNIHKPKIWIFGHWHRDKDEVINGTRFICLNELSYCDVDMETLEVTWPKIKRMGE
jgi:predicted phosphodiesterase